jgi:rhodanese-related sulfurtransferase
MPIASASALAPGITLGDLVDMRSNFYRAIVFLVAVIAVGGCVVGAPTTNPNAGGPLEISVQDAAQLWDEGAFILDVREPSEWATGHIPDATLIPLGELASRVEEVPADRTVVVVCRSGNRSAEGRDILRQAGLTAVTSMSGGMNVWAAAGLPVVVGS